MVVVHTFNPSTLEVEAGGSVSLHSGGRGRWICESEASLAYSAISRTAWAIHRNPVLKTKPTNNPKFLR